MKNDLTKRLYEASVIEVPEQSALTEYQLTELEKLVKPLLTLDELNNYIKGEQYEKSRIMGLYNF